MEMDPASRRWMAGIIAISGAAMLVDRALDPRPSTSWWTGLLCLALARLTVTPEGTWTHLALRVAVGALAILHTWHLVSYYLS